MLLAALKASELEMEGLVEGGRIPGAASGCELGGPLRSLLEGRGASGGGGGSPGEEQLLRAEGWLGACHHLLRLFRGTGTSVGAASRQRGGSASVQLEECSTALRRLANSPSLQPALLLHPQQEEALRPWLRASPARPPPLMAPPGTSPAQPSSTGMGDDAPASQEAVMVGSTDGQGGTVVGNTVLPDGTRMPTAVLLYNDSSGAVTMDVRELVDW